MYRDNLEALRQRSHELDRELAALPPPPPREPTAWKLRASALTWLALGVLGLWVGIERLSQQSRGLDAQRAQEAAMRAVLARATAPAEPSSSEAHTTSGRACSIIVKPPCRAEIVCEGGVLYQGAGTCSDGRYVDPADSWLDGTPICVIDFGRKRAMVRDVRCHRRFRDDFYDDVSRVDLVLP
jgi:hypothetical protein